LLLSFIRHLHHVANRLPLQPEQAVNCSKRKSTFAIPKNPHSDFVTRSDLVSGVRKRRFECADLRLFGPHFLNSSAGGREIEIKTFGPISRRARNR
jgi:hypothetical protein